MEATFAGCQGQSAQNRLTEMKRNSVCDWKCCAVIGTHHVFSFGDAHFPHISHCRVPLKAFVSTVGGQFCQSTKQ